MLSGSDHSKLFMGCPHFWLFQVRQGLCRESSGAHGCGHRLRCKKHLRWLLQSRYWPVRLFLRRLWSSHLYILPRDGSRSRNSPGACDFVCFQIGVHHNSEVSIHMTVFIESPRQTLKDSPIDLAFDLQGVHRSAAGVNGDHPIDMNHSQLSVNGHFDELSSSNPFKS